MKHQTLLALYIGLAAAAPLNAKWQRIPTSGSKPLPIAARGMQSQGSLISSSGFGKAESLLSDDNTDPVSVSAGNSSAVISLGKPTMLSRSSFTSDGIEGRATLSASGDNKGWAVLDEKVFTASDRDIQFAFAGIQVKFLKLEFALSKGGIIRNFQMFGGEDDKDYTVKQSEDGKGGYPVNFAGVGGSRVLYASPTPEGGLDESASFNKFSFPESDERYRTLIYDLGQVRMMNTFGSVHSPRPVRFEVFAFDKLPEKEDWRGRLAFDPKDFSAREPVAAAEDTRGLGYLNAKPDKMVKARYVALRWEPDFNPPAFGVSAPRIGGSGFPSFTPGAGGPGAGAAPGQGGTPPGGGGAGEDPGQRDNTPPQNVPFQGSPSSNGIGLNSGANSP